ncbi:chitin synthase [Ceratobasidium sp. AG-Ba]|nr:chitin synthase [Ceratobasidium sp. AG-Ba]
MIAATYGLQAVMFLLKREFMLVGWMLVYVGSYPVYSCFLPIYSFWCIDNFSWGNAHITQGDGKGGNVVVVPEDNHFDDSMIPLKKFSDGTSLEYEAEVRETGSHKSEESKRTGFTQAAKSMSAQDFARRRNGDGGQAASYQAGSQTGDYYRITNRRLLPDHKQETITVTQTLPSKLAEPMGSSDAHATGNSGLGAELGVGGGRPLSTFSMATTVNPLTSGLSQILGRHLASQDLFTTTEN